MDFTGRIIAVLPLKEGVSREGKPWATQSYVLETQEQYPQRICFEVWGKDKIDKFSLTVNASVSISVSFDARQWKETYINQIRCWKCEYNGQQLPLSTRQQPAQQQPDVSPFVPTGPGDDLPF